MDQTSEQDLEKSGVAAQVNPTTHHGSDTPSNNSSVEHEVAPTPNLLRGRLAKWNDKVESLSGLEARGVRRVMPDERTDRGLCVYIQMFLLWFSINLVAINITSGLLGPLLFELGWVDSVCVVVFAIMISACGPAYTSTFGPLSGCRTMVSAQSEYMMSPDDSIPQVTARFDSCCRLEKIDVLMRVFPTDPWPLCHGILAFETSGYTEPHPGAWIWHHCLHHRWPDDLGCQRPRLDCRCWLYHLRPPYCYCGYIWYQAIRQVREVCPFLT